MSPRYSSSQDNNIQQESSPSQFYKGLIVLFLKDCSLSYILESTRQYIAPCKVKRRKCYFILLSKYIISHTSLNQDYARY
jgi:hypothetical protein